MRACVSVRESPQMRILVNLSFEWYYTNEHDFILRSYTAVTLTEINVEFANLDFVDLNMLMFDDGSLSLFITHNMYINWIVAWTVLHPQGSIL